MTENVFYPVFLWLAFVLVADARAADAAAPGAPARRVRRRLRDARAGGRARRGGADRTARPCVDRAWPAAAALGVRAAVRDRRRRRGRRHRREVARGRSPAAILGDYSVTSNGGYRSAGAPVLRAPRRRARSRTLRAPVCGAPRARRECARLDRRLRVFAAASARSRCGSCSRSRCSRRATRSGRGAQPLLPRAALRHRAARVDRARPASRRARRSPPRASPRALPASIPFAHLHEHHEPSPTRSGCCPGGSRTTCAPADAGRRRRGRAGVSLLGALFLWLPRTVRTVLPLLVAAVLRLTWLRRRDCGRTASRRLAKGAARPGIGRKRTELDRRGGGAQRPRRRRLDRAATTSPCGRTSS